VSQKGFWWRVPIDTPLYAGKRDVFWPYWHDADGETDDGLVDWSHRPVYCNGSFWDGLSVAFQGEYRPCGVLALKGAAAVEFVPAAMDCCIYPDMPWTIDLAFTGLQDYPDKTPRSGSIRLFYYYHGLGGPCQWVSASDGTGLGASWTPDNLEVVFIDEDGTPLWSCTVLIGVFGTNSGADSFDLFTLGWLDNYGDSIGSAVLTRVDHSGGCGGPFNYFSTDGGDVIVTDDDEALAID
jgi:hypothetical protein